MNKESRVNRNTTPRAPHGASPHPLPNDALHASARGPARQALPRRAWAALTLTLALAGCAQIPPEPAQPAQRDLAGAALAADIGLAGQAWPAAQWWTGYGDAQLNALVAQALAAAPSLEVAAAHIAGARAAVARVGADAGLEVDAGVGANRQRYSANGLFPAPIGGAWFSEETVRLEAHYQFDWWGRNRARIAAAVGEANASRAAYAQAAQTLTAAIAQSYFRLQGTWARLDDLERQLAIQSALVQDQARRVEHGLAASDAHQAAVAELSQLQAQHAGLSADADHEREALRALLGADGNALRDLHPQTQAPLPHALPAQLGMELLARRPDLQAARWRVQASLSQAEAAQAAYYPEINLAASAGLNAISLEHLLQAGSRTLYLGPSLTLPLFDSRRLNAQLEGARSERREQIAAYNQAVVDAVREVAQDAIALRGIEQQIDRQAGATGSAAERLRSARARAAHGLADRNSVLTAELALLRQQDAALALQHRQLLAEVALTHALGGGYRYHDGDGDADAAPARGTAAARLP